MTELTQSTFETFLGNLAARQPTPGGGSASAAAGALACAAARMVAAYSVSPKTDPAVKEQIQRFAARLRTCDELLRALITQDARAYAAMKDAAQRVKDGSAGEAEYQEAVMSAVAVPMETAAAAGNALAVLDEFKELASRYLLSDLGVAASLAEGAAHAAYFTVLVNLRELADVTVQAKLIREIGRLLEHVLERSRNVQVYVRHHLEDQAARNR